MRNDDDNEKRILNVIDITSQHARTIYYIYLGFISYSIITAYGTSDRQLALKDDRVNLPILNISVPLQGFFIVATIITLLLFVYFMLYLRRLDTLIEDLTNINPSFNKRNLYPWMINIVRMPDDGIIGTIQSLFTSITTWFSLPITLFIIVGRFLKKHDEIYSYVLVSAAFLSICLVIWFRNNLNIENTNRQNNFLEDPIRIITIIFLILSVCVLVPEINNGRHGWANLNLRNEVLISVPKQGEDFKQRYWVDMEGVNLNGADLSFTVLRHGNLKDAKLNNAKLQDSDLFGINLQNAELQNAELTRVVFQKATLSGAKLNEADIHCADFRNAVLSATNFQKAFLTDTDFQDTSLDLADFRNATLTGANFSGAVAYYIYFQGAKGITAEQLCTTTTLFQTELDPNILKGLIESCPYKLSEYSYEDARKIDESCPRLQKATQ